MAVFKPSSVSSRYHRWIPTPKQQKIVQFSLDARRALILSKRLLKGGYSAYDIPIIGSFMPDTTRQVEFDLYKNKIKLLHNLNQGMSAPDTAKHSGFGVNGVNRRIKTLSDSVSIIDLDAKGANNQYETINLPFIPKELNYNSQSSFVAIRPIGANNPRYQFTGAEDKLEFEIDWYAFDDDRRGVIEACRKLESLSKSDSYIGNPHRVKLQWGEDSVLFDDHIFIVLDAPYKLSNFNKGYIKKDKTVKSTHMLPIQAYQKITLGRITSNNMSKVDIEYVKQPSIL